MLLTSRVLSRVEMRIFQTWISQQIKQCTTNAKCLNLEVGILVWVGEVGSRKKREADGMWESSKLCIFANCTVKLKGLVQSASTNLKPSKLSVDSTPRYRLVLTTDETCFHPDEEESVARSRISRQPFCRNWRQKTTRKIESRRVVSTEKSPRNSPTRNLVAMNNYIKPWTAFLMQHFAYIISILIKNLNSPSAAR